MQGTILRHVTRLHHLKENWILSNSEDLYAVQIDDGEFYNPIELIPEPSFSPDRKLLETDAQAQADATQATFRLPLISEPRLCRFFDLVSTGTEKTRDLAATLNLHPSKISNLRRRLQRRWRKRVGTLSSPRA